MTQLPEAVEGILARLAKDVERSVHALYRSETGAATAKVRTEHLVRDAQERLLAFFRSTPPVPGTPGAPPPRFSAVTAATPGQSAAEWSPDEAAAVTKCINAWLSMGSPRTTAPDTKCIPAGRELVPTWGERERARGAVMKVAGGVKA